MNRKDVGKILTKGKKKMALAAATMYVTMNNMMFAAYADPTSADTTADGIENMDANKVFNGILQILQTIGKYVGAMAVAGGIFMYLQAKKDDNPNAESKAQMAIAVGIAFFLLPALLAAVFPNSSGS